MSANREKSLLSGGAEALATIREVAAFLKVPPKTLYRWRYLGVGPRAYRVGKHLRFRWEDVETWLEERGDRQRGASEAPRRVIGR